MSTPIYQRLAALVQAHATCHNTANWTWKDKHASAIRELMNAHSPSGSGFDSGTRIDLDACTPEKLVFRTAFHHMTEQGYYGWTHHNVIVQPSLQFQFNLKISGPNRNDIKEYVHECFAGFLRTEV